LKKYKTCSWSNRIEIIDVDRETDSFVFIKGRRLCKNTEENLYADTFAEAKQHLLDLAERKVNSARLELERAKARYGNVKGLKEL